MKKILLLLLLLLLLPCNINALNYSPYSEYKYTDNLVKKQENCQVEELKKYKFYKLEKDYTDNYYNSNFKDDYYIYKDSEYIYSDVITSQVKPSSDEIFDLEEKKYTYYQEYKKVKYIILYNFDYNDYLKIKEIKIYDKNNKIVDYEIIKGSSVINDYDRSTSVKINRNDIIILKFTKDMAVADFDINIYVTGKYTKTFSFDYLVNYKEELSDSPYYGTLNGKLSSEEHYRINLSNSNYIEDYDDEIKVIEGYFEEINNARIIKYETIYNYREKLYKYYNYKRIYLDDYYFEKDNYIKDLDSYKLTYRYRCRSILNNVVSSDKIGYKNKEEYLELKNNRDKIVNDFNNNQNLVTINLGNSKTTSVLQVKENNNLPITDNSEIVNNNYCQFNNNLTKKDDNSSNYNKLIITILGLMIIFII